MGYNTTGTMANAKPMVNHARVPARIGFAFAATLLRNLGSVSVDWVKATLSIPPTVPMMYRTPTMIAVLRCVFISCLLILRLMRFSE
jgi:hypothetical protein